jgi:hypothetical protein
MNIFNGKTVSGHQTNLGTTLSSGRSIVILRMKRETFPIPQNRVKGTEGTISILKSVVGSVLISDINCSFYLSRKESDQNVQGNSDREGHMTSTKPALLSLGSLTSCLRSSARRGIFGLYSCFFGHHFSTPIAVL